MWLERLTTSDPAAARYYGELFGGTSDGASDGRARREYRSSPTKARHRAVASPAPGVRRVGATTSAVPSISKPRRGEGGRRTVAWAARSAGRRSSSSERSRAANRLVGKAEEIHHGQ